MGMRQRLGLAACLLGDPELLILDEPMNGLDPAGIHEMRDLIRGLVDEGRTVMLCSLLLDEVQRTCDQVAIVDRGKVIRQGPIDELLRGTAEAVEIRCLDGAAAARALDRIPIASGVTVADGGLRSRSRRAGPAERGRDQPAAGRGRHRRVRRPARADQPGGLVPFRDGTSGYSAGLVTPRRKDGCRPPCASWLSPTPPEARATY